MRRRVRRHRRAMETVRCLNGKMLTASVATFPEFYGITELPLDATLLAFAAAEGMSLAAQLTVSWRRCHLDCYATSLTLILPAQT